jgi:hypothetical protein
MYTNSTSLNLVMLKTFIISGFVLMTVASCKNTSTQALPYSIKDTVLNEHLLALDSALYFDTTEINYKVLKAYQKNDTAFFKKLRLDIIKEKQFATERQLMDSCIHLQKLQDLKVDEAYRFIFTAAFCPYKLNVTVSKKADTANIHFIVYQYKWDTAVCRIISEYDKKLNSKDWETFSEAIDKSDFWGLKQQNGIHGLDGSTLITMGFIKAKNTFDTRPQYNYVYRWENTTLRDPFNLILKLSGNKQGCFWIE